MPLSGHLHLTRTAGGWVAGSSEPTHSFLITQVIGGQSFPKFSFFACFLLTTLLKRIQIQQEFMLEYLKVRVWNPSPRGRHEGKLEGKPPRPRQHSWTQRPLQSGGLGFWQLPQRPPQSPAGPPRHGYCQSSSSRGDFRFRPRASLGLRNHQNNPQVFSPPANAGDVRDLGSIPGLGRSPGGGHGNLLQYSCLKNPHGQRSLAGYSPWGHKDSDTTKWQSIAQIRNCEKLKNMWKK